MRLSLRYTFSAAHRLHSRELGEEQNWAVYGKCNNPHGHGHNYSLEVQVEGEADPVSGLLVERARLDEWVGKEILARVNFRNLNEQVREFQNLVPTTENVAKVFAEILEESWPRYFGDRTHLRFAGIRMHETRNNLFELARQRAGSMQEES